MPINYLASLTACERTARANLHLGTLLAFVAGALNAGGFLAIGRYTSHMSGMLSSTADSLVLGELPLMVTALLSILSFSLGAALTAIMVNYARRNCPRNLYTPTLLLEAILLLTFGLIGRHLQAHDFIRLSLTAILLCFTMGLQNALITKISNAEIRTTHVTGMFTDIGIEIGKLLYWNRTAADGHPPVIADRRRLRMHVQLVCTFLAGGIVGAIGFKHVGFAAAIPLAIGLVIMSLAPMFKVRQS